MRSLPTRFLLTVSLVALCACAAYAKTTINKINADPSRYQNKKVTIEGTVTDSYGAWREGAYEIDDGTGRIWVVASDRIVPAKGAHIEVKGHIYTGFVIGGHNMGTVLQETGRKAKDHH